MNYNANFSISASVFTLIEALTQRPAHWNIQPAAGFELIEELFFHLLDTLAISGNINQIVTFVWIGLKIVETIMIPNTLIENILVPLASDGKNRWRSREVPFPVILVKYMVAPWN